MKIITFPLGQLQANCYFLIEGDECLIIDPADEASFILEELQRRNLRLVGILATHGHFDHVMAAGEIQKSINTPFYISEEDEFLVTRLEETAEYFLGFKPVILKPNTINPLRQSSSEASRFIVFSKKVKNFNFEVILTPGHTPGGVCYYFPSVKVIFTGDTLFKRGIGRYDFSYSSKQDLKQSIQKILKLSPEAVVYPGHGESTTIEAEKDILEIYPL